jgi:hypothetical protein
MWSEVIPSGDADVSPSVSDGAGGLHEQLRGALRLALDDADRGGDASMGELRTTIRRACQSARESGLRAEQLLIIVKEVWRELPEARHVPHSDADDVLARVITLCVNEYYTPHHE